MNVQILKKGDGKILVEGQEITEVYCNTGKISFAVSTLLPGQKSSVDQGHREADEVCYVAQGILAMQIPGTDENYILQAGEAALISQGVPHATINIGEMPSIAIWACAPKP